MYYNGAGVAQDYKEAVKWYTLAAEQQASLAQNNLGVMYENGTGVAQDYKDAIKWYTLAAEQGHNSAQYNLGLMYAKGAGVLQSYLLAHMWLNISASNGDKSAIDARNTVEQRLQQIDVVTAQEIARKCIENLYKDCGL